MSLRLGGKTTTRRMESTKFLNDRALALLENAPPKSFVGVFLAPGSRDVDWYPDDPTDARKCPYEIGQIIGKRVLTRLTEIEGEWAHPRTTVVDMYFVEAEKPGETYKFQNTRKEDDCDELYQHCGPDRKDGNGRPIPCYKRHVRTVRLSALRPPCGLDVLRDTRRVSARNRNNRAQASHQVRDSTIVAYSMSRGTRQVLENTLKEDSARWGGVHVI